MLKIEELRRERAEVNASVQALSEIEKTGNLSADQLAEFESLSIKFDELTASISRLEDAEKMAAKSAEPVAAYGGAPAVHVKAEPKQYLGAGVARMAMAVAAGAGDLTVASTFAANELNDKDVSMAINTSAGSGGALIPQNLRDEVIDLLRPKTVVRGLGAFPMPLPNGNLSIPSMSSGAQSSYIGEGDDIPVSEAAFGDVKLSAKTLVTLVPISNQLIGRAGFNVERIFLADIINNKAVREDKAFLRDDGTNDTPTGFKATATAAGQTVAWSSTPELTGIDAFLDEIILKLMSSDSMLTSPGWALSPRSYMKLFGLRDGNGNKVYPEIAKGMLKGWPIKHTTTIPSNLGLDSNESEIYFADWNDVIIGEGDSMRLDFSKEAVYKDAGGNLVSAFSRDQSLIRLIDEHDIGFRHIESLALGTGVTW